MVDVMFFQLRILSELNVSLFLRQKLDLGVNDFQKKRTRRILVIFSLTRGLGKNIFEIGHGYITQVRLTDYDEVIISRVIINY